MGLQTLGLNPVRSYVTQLVVVIQQVLILLLSAHFCHNVHIGILGNVIQEKDGALDEERKRLAIDVIKPAELEDV